MYQVLDPKARNDWSTIFELLRRTANGSIALDLSRVPDEWIVKLLIGMNDSNPPTVARGEPQKPQGPKRNRQRARPVKRARQRLRVVRKTLRKTVLENRSKLLF